MSQPAARIGDMHTCPMVTPGMPPVPHVGGPVQVGEPTVLIGGMPAARMGDMCVCVGPPDVIIKGSMGVLIGNKPAARMGDSTAHGGIITLGFPTVLIGDIMVVVLEPSVPIAPTTPIQPEKEEKHNNSNSNNNQSTSSQNTPSVSNNNSGNKTTNLPVNNHNAINNATGGKHPALESPCAIIEKLEKEPTTLAEKKEHIQNQKALDAAVANEAGNRPIKERQHLIDSVKQYEKTASDVEKAKLSDAVYEGEEPLGWKKVSAKELNLTSNLKDNASGFKSEVYMNTAGGEPKYVLAFAGTDFPKEGASGFLTDAEFRKDVGANLSQGMGRTGGQYKQAMLLAKEMKESNISFEVTGHSLGGGLASAASKASGADAVTFNAAGLHSNTVKMNQISNIDAYYNSTDPLSNYQDSRVSLFNKASVVAALFGSSNASLVLQALKLSGALPKAAGNRIKIQPIDKSTEGHSMKDMIKLMEHKEKQDLQKLKGNLGCGRGI